MLLAHTVHTALYLDTYAKCKGEL